MRHSASRNNMANEHRMKDSEVCQNFYQLYWRGWSLVDLDIVLGRNFEAEKTFNLNQHNIVRHTAQTNISWSNSKKWPMNHISDLMGMMMVMMMMMMMMTTTMMMMMIRCSTKILTCGRKEMGQLMTRGPYIALEIDLTLDTNSADQLHICRRRYMPQFHKHTKTVFN